MASEAGDYEARSSAILDDHVLASFDFLVTTKRRFWIEGPNGRHLCLVMPLVGPNLSILSSGICSRLKPPLAAVVAHQAAQAMSLLHSNGKCHGGTFPEFQTLDELAT